MDDGSPTKISSAKSAANTFVDAMSDNPNNRVGLVSFASTTTKDQSLTNSFSTVKTKINNLHADGATQMRQALYQAISDLDQNGRSEAVKAVILLTDGDWNYDGSPLAVGNGFPSSDTILGNNIATWSGVATDFSTYYYYSGIGGGVSHNQNVNVPNGETQIGWSPDVYQPRYTNKVATYYTGAEFTSQNMSIFASENEVRLYALSFVDQPSAAVQTALTIMTTGTEKGFYQHAPNADALEDLYATIATQLQEDAGVDTTADMDFGQLIVDDQLMDTSTPGNAMFDYVADPITPGINPGNSYVNAPGSSMVDKYNATTKLIPGPDFTQTGPLIVNQTPEWVANKALHFNIGLVKLGETWETNFRLRVLKEGTILLFSPGSTVNFKDSNGVESSLTLGNLSYLTVLDNPTNLTVPTINVNLVCPPPVDNTTAVLPITWTTTYTGGETDIIEEVRYMSESGAMVPIDQGGYHVTGDSTHSGNTEFDMRTVAPGSYRILVHAYTSGATSTSSPFCGPYVYSTEGKAFIRLK